jgi:outer membrane protein OmpU
MRQAVEFLQVGRSTRTMGMSPFGATRKGTIELMKNLLLASAAVVALGMAAADAHAQMTVTIGGSVQSEGANASRDIETGRDTNSHTTARISIDAKAKADNGLAYGATTKLLADTVGGDGILMDQAFIHVGGGFGLVEFGATEGAVAKMAVGAPKVGLGQALGDYDKYGAASSGGLSYGRKPFLALTPDAGTSNKLTYFTPRFSGFGVGLSYTPNTTDTRTGFARNVLGTNYVDTFEAGATYERDLGGVGLKIGAGMTTADAAQGANVKDYTAWNSGLSLSWQGFTVGGSYTDAQDFNKRRNVTIDTDQKAWTFGASYDVGQFTVGANMLMAEGYNDNRVGSYADKHDAYGVGVAYRLAPGLQLMGDVVKFEEEVRAAPGAATKRDNDGTIVTVGARVNF